MHSTDGRSCAGISSECASCDREACLKTWINYHHLLYFKTIAEQGSVSRAAQVLRLGQPTLSAQLKQLEERLGVDLFERSHRKLVLSEHGKVALDYAQRIFSLGEEMYDAVQDKIVPQREHLRVGALDSIPKQVLLQLTKLAYKLRKTQISLFEGKPDEMLRELSAHRIDLFVSNFVPLATEGRGLIHKLIVKKPVAIYGAPKFKSLRKDFPNSLTGQPTIVPTFDSKLRYDLEHWLQTRGLVLDFIAETQDISLKKFMAVDGMALIAAAAHAVNRQVLAGDLVEIGKVDGVFEELYFVRMPRKIPNSLTMQLFDQFKI